eukprot:321489-Chlamydomonas_euryale.AAC.2
MVPLRSVVLPGLCAHGLCELYEDLLKCGAGDAPVHDSQPSGVARICNSRKDVRHCHVASRELKFEHARDAVREHAVGRHALHERLGGALLLNRHQDVEDEVAGVAALDLLGVADAHEAPVNKDA